ncbi:uncharacterized protein N7479_009905 [Penicillium vulpinum]|uniref:uncharacterized protein n=1 Tax=Penicillium vulpinum TaxID=29845 RepID=UPI002547F91F|nr:uncharacterized protein N7479_009905 [Penicillium vulpinum]KAJ5951492.1 hypothetical protein N7479_009905 [Penicillium vulpinum]
MYVQELLRVSHGPRTTKKKWMLVDKLIETWLCGKYSCVRNYLDPALFSDPLENDRFWEWIGNARRWWGTLDEMLLIALATCAIVRGDVVGLQAVIDQCKEMPEIRSVEFLENKGG